MPVINIREIDTTSAVITNTDVYTVFVPGNCTYSEGTAKYFGAYTTFTTLSDFIKAIGEVTYGSAENSPYGYLDKDGNLVYADPGYRIAKLLLSNNLPVIYYVPEPTIVKSYVLASPQPATASDFAEGTYYTAGGTKINTWASLFTQADTFVEGTEYWTESSGTYSVADPQPTSETFGEGTYYTKADCYVEVETPTTPSWSEMVSAVNAATTTTTDSIFEILKDKSLYDFRYVTNGGYSCVQVSDTPITIPNSIKSVKEVAETRGDCIAVVDFEKSAKAKTLASLVETPAEGTNALAALASKYVQLATPWCIYDGVSLPANFAILEAFGNQTQTSPNWFATAGFLRGEIHGEPCEVIGETLANKLTTKNGVSINPITNVGTSATTHQILIWGNRTAFLNKGKLKASSFLNIRQLCCDLSKRLYRSAKQQMFEQNTDRLWFNFKAPIVKLLDNMLQSEGVSGYEIYKLNSTEKAQVRALVRIVPIEAVEEFDLTIELTDSLDVTVNEE